MKPASPFTVRCETQELLDNLDAIASAMDRSRSWVINQACKDFVETNKWQIQAIKDGINSLEQGKYVAHDELMQKVENKIRKNGNL